MLPRGVFRLMAPVISRTGKKNLRDTAQALQAFLER
jgi:hypothetical protein